MTGVKSVLGFLLSAVAVAVAAAGVYLVTDRLALDERAAERRALLTRQNELTARLIVPGSPLACLDSGAGEAVGNACEKAVFADAATTASAVAFTAARLDLLKDAATLAQKGEGDIAGAFATVRRAIELDRYGLAAQVLADRDGCTPDRCAAFALLGHTDVLKANMKARVFDQYVSRYAPAWEQGMPAPNAVPQASVPPAEQHPAPVASVEPPAGAVPAGRPVDPKWDFPSAASIPPVSIMNSEPPRPKEPEAQAAPKSEANAADAVPVPPKRPQAPAPTAAPSR